MSSSFCWFFLKIFRGLNIVFFFGNATYMFDFFPWLKTQKRTTAEPPHPEKKEAGEIPPTAAAVLAAFDGCGDFEQREIAVGGRRDAPGLVCWLDGLVDGTDVSELVLRPLVNSPALRRSAADTERIALILRGEVWCCALSERRTLRETQEDLVQGRCALLLGGRALTFETRSREGRSITEPTLDKAVLGAKDAFTELYRVNTALVRRHLRSGELKLTELTVGRRSGTRVGVFHVEGMCRRAVTEEVLRRLGEADIDGVTALGDVERFLTAPPRSAFPRAIYTERPDRFCRALLQGRVGILIDGLPQGLLVPCTLPEMLRVAEDRCSHAAVASALLLLRWGALLLSLLLPALYVAVAVYHQEMIPLRLLESVIQAEQDVPFSTAAEILGMLWAFGLLQEAGLRLPVPAGTAVSIIGTLIVGQSAVEAKVVSPIAVIVVALSGIAGYTQPNQQLGAALRLWRTLLAACAALLGMYGLMAGAIVLVWRLCSLESFGVSYLYPLTDGGRGGLLRALLQPPLRWERYRDAALRGWNRRAQK